MKIIKKLNFIFWAILCFSFLPLLAEAGTCTNGGGMCVDNASCGQTLGTIDDCTGPEVCCNPATIDYKEGSTGGFMFLKGHIVPCGRATDDPNDALGIDETAECTLCHMFIMLKRVADLIFSLMIIAAILFITIGGVIYIVSTGNPNLTGIAKNIIKKTLIGFALMIIGWSIVYTLLVFLSAGDMIGTNGSWYNFTCDTESKFKQP